MIKNIIVALSLAFIPVTISAQQIDTEDIARYAARGAVPTTDTGTVEWNTVITNHDTTTEELFNRLEQWLKSRLDRPSAGIRSRITRNDRSTGELAAWLQEPLVFRHSALVSDEAQMTYHITLHINDDCTCDVTLNRISYRYDAMQTAGLAEAADITAEEWITDRNALTKSGKLNRICGKKFRVHTIAHIEKLFDSIRKAVAEK